MALAFPDLASARTVAATHPGRANLIVCLFFAHHLLLLATPVYLLRTAVATRRGGGRDERLPPGRAFVRYVAFSYYRAHLRRKKLAQVDVDSDEEG